MNWLKLLTPGFWRRRKALRILHHAKFECAIQDNMEAQVLLTRKIFEVMDDCGGECSR